MLKEMKMKIPDPLMDAAHKAAENEASKFGKRRWRSINDPISFRPGR
jgi:hypothetical protein